MEGAGVSGLIAHVGGEQFGVGDLPGGFVVAIGLLARLAARRAGEMADRGGKGAPGSGTATVSSTWATTGAVVLLGCCWCRFLRRSLRLAMMLLLEDEIDLIWAWA